MTIQLNGKPREIEAGTTLRRLLDDLHLDALRVAVQVNLEIVKRERHASVALGPGDEVEILTFMAGG